MLESSFVNDGAYLKALERSGQDRIPPTVWALSVDNARYKLLSVHVVRCPQLTGSGQRFETGFFCGPLEVVHFCES